MPQTGFGDENNDAVARQDDYSSVEGTVNMDMDQSNMVEEASVAQRGKSDNDSFVGAFEQQITSFDTPNRNRSSIAAFMESFHSAPAPQRELSLKGFNDTDSLVSDLPDPLQSDTASIRQSSRQVSVSKLHDNAEDDEEMDEDMFQRLQELNASGIDDYDRDVDQESIFDDQSAKKDGESIFGSMDNVLLMLPDTNQRKSALATIEDSHAQHPEPVEVIEPEPEVVESQHELQHEDSNVVQTEEEGIKSIETNEKEEEVVIFDTKVGEQEEAHLTSVKEEEQEVVVDYTHITDDLIESEIIEVSKDTYQEQVLSVSLASEMVNASMDISMGNAVEKFLQIEREANVDQVKNIVSDQIETAIEEALFKTPKKIERIQPETNTEIIPSFELSRSKSDDKIVVAPLESEPAVEQEVQPNDSVEVTAEPVLEPEAKPVPEPEPEPEHEQISTLDAQGDNIESGETFSATTEPMELETNNEKQENITNTLSNAISNEVKQEVENNQIFNQQDENIDVVQPLSLQPVEPFNEDDLGPLTNTNESVDERHLGISNEDNLFGDVDNMMESKDVDSFLQNQLDELEKSGDVSVESSKSELKQMDKMIVSFRQTVRKLNPANIIATKMIDKLLKEAIVSESLLIKLHQKQQVLEPETSAPKVEAEEPEASANEGVSDSSKNSDVASEINEQQENDPENMDELLASLDNIEEGDSNALFHCIQQLPLEQQKTVYNLFTLLVRESFISLMDNSIPTLTKEMESEFSTLSTIFDDMNNFHYTHLRGLKPSKITNEKPSVLEYDETKYIDNFKKQELVKVLKKAENKLKKRLTKLTEISKSLYDGIDAKVHRLRQLGSFIDSVNAHKTSPKRKSANQLKFCMTDVIDYLRDPSGLIRTKINAVYESEIKPRENMILSKSKASYSQLLSNLFTIHSSNLTLNTRSPQKDAKAERTIRLQREAQKHLHHKIDKFISTKIRYKESVTLKQKAKVLLERHLEGQLKRMNGLLNKINHHYDAYEEGDNISDQISDVSGDEEGLTKTDRLTIEVQQGRIRPKSKDKRTIKNAHDEDPPSPFKATPYKLPSPEEFHIPEPVGKYHTIKENRLSVAKPTVDTKRDKELARLFQLCQGLDLENPNHAYNLKEPLPSANPRPKSAGRMSTAALQTAAKKLGYMKFDIYEDGKKIKQSSSTPFIENMLFKPEKDTGLPRDVIAMYQFSPKRAAKVFRHNPIDKKEKQRLQESNRIAKFSPTRDGGNNQEKSGNGKKSLAPVDSESTYNLEEIIMGKKSAKKKTSPKKVPGTPVIFELESDDEKIPKSEEKSQSFKLNADVKGAKSHKQLSSGAKSSLSLFAVAAEEAEAASKTTMEYRADAKMSKYNMDYDDAELLEALDGPILWNGDAKSPTTAPANVPVFASEKAATQANLYDQQSLDPMEFNSLVEVGAKITEIFEERGIINDGELLNPRILYVQVDSAFEELRKEDNNKFGDTEELLEEEVSQLSTLLVGLMDDLNSFVNDELIHHFHMGLHQSKLLRKEVEIELMETFWAKSLEFSRLRDLGVLSIPADVTDAKFFEHPIHNIDPKKSLKLDDYYNDDDVLELSKEIDEGFTSPTPFRIGGEKLKLTTSTKEGILASHPRSLIDQQLDFHLHNITKLRKHLRVSLYNLVEITMADALHVSCYLLITELKHLKMKTHYRSLRSKLLQSPSKKASKNEKPEGEEENFRQMLDELVQNSDVRTLFHHSFHKYGLEDYVVEKCKLKCKFLNHGMKQLKSMTEECLKEAKETSKLLV